MCRRKHYSTAANIPGPCLSHSLPRDSTPLALRGKGPKALLLKLFPVGQGPQTVAYPRDVEILR